MKTLQSKGLIKAYDPDMLANECLNKGLARRYELLIHAGVPGSSERIKRELAAQFEQFWLWIKKD